MEELNVANTIFALNFFKHLANTSANTQNIFFCPWSVSSTMAMVYLGARGNTADQIAQVSFCSGSQLGLKDSWTELQNWSDYMLVVSGLKQSQWLVES